MSLDFLYTAVSWVLLRWHQLFSFIGLDEDSGLNWALSIVFLVITARMLLFRFFVKQIKSQRHMQEMQPRLTAIREKYKNDRQAQQREMMKLQQEEGFNPIAGCLPLVLQIPVFISLFHVLRHLSNSVALCRTQSFADPKLSLYTFTAKQTCSAADAKLFNGAPLAGSLRDGAARIDQLGGDLTTTRIVTLLLVLISAAATFYTQLLVKRAAITAPVGTAATVQRIMLYFIPLSVLGSGLFFPLGVLLYWFTSNVWTMGQQLYVNKFHPHVPKEEPPIGEVGRTLAPRPGQKPVRDRRVVNDVNSDPADGAGSSGNASGRASSNGVAPRSTTPRPGQRPNRPSGGGRPASKRPSQSKKRR
ncbi:MAG: membrane protein insertase YidC [Actinomycetota bacterium]